MNFTNIARKRFAVREFADKPVKEEDILKILDAARIAPSACNYQPVHFVVLRDEIQKELVCSTYDGEWLQKAPVIIVVCGDYGLSWKRPHDGKDHCEIDVAIAVDHLTLAAADLGLGTCWVCNFDTEKCGEYIHLPERLGAIALIPLGYPVQEADMDRHVETRRDLEQVVHWDRF
ncbi:MAG: nitroreductase [Clostridiales bacterium]|nr:nitroreductase [Clostridiales bacterium]